MISKIRLNPLEDCISKVSIETVYKDMVINCGLYRHVAFVKRKEHIIINFQKSFFSAVTRTIC